MKLLLTVIGKTSSPYIVDGIELFVKRLRHYVPFELRTLPDIRAGKSMSEAMQKQREGEMILSSLVPGDFVVLLDERGSELTSREFAMFIDKKMASISSNIVFVVGGPYGFSQSVYDRADYKLSLSRMTFPHEMVRLFFVEQIYRAFTILRGEPYHHD